MRGLVLVVIAVGGCGRVGFDGLTASEDAAQPSGSMNRDGATVGDGAAIGNDAANVGGDAGVGSGSGTISGTAPDGMPFTTLVTGYYIGHPKFLGETSIYMFSNPIACSDIGYPGWGQWITAGTQAMELQLPAKTTGTFAVQASEPPAAQTGFGRYRYGEGSGGEITGGGSGGQVVVTNVGADGSITGTFTITFSMHGPLVGTFTAISCPTGWYPTFP